MLSGFLSQSPALFTRLFKADPRPKATRGGYSISAGFQLVGPTRVTATQLGKGADCN